MRGMLSAMDDPTEAPAPSRTVPLVARPSRLARELHTVGTMVAMYCHDVHGRENPLCDECTALVTYATRRIDRCIFGDDKPTCANCKVHCYNRTMREDVRTVMRYAGPRMIRRHPMLAIMHVVDGRRPAPELPVTHRVRPRPESAAREHDPPPSAESRL